MEENMETNSQNIEENDKEAIAPKKCAAIRNYFKEYSGILLAAFLGGFLAIYFVADQIFERNQISSMYIKPDKFHHQMMKDIDNMNKMIERDKRMFKNNFDKFEKDFERNFTNSFILPSSAMEGVNIKSEIDENEYKIEIDLKAFQNDENKIQYSVNGNKLSVWGKSIVEEKNFKQEVSFSQDFILPKNADLSKITKTRDADDLIIRVPLIKK